MKIVFLNNFHLQLLPTVCDPCCNINMTKRHKVFFLFRNKIVINFGDIFIYVARGKNCSAYIFYMIMCYIGLIYDFIKGS